MISIKNLPPCEELEIPEGYQRIYLTLEMRGLRRHPLAPANYKFKPTLSHRYKGDVGYKSVTDLPRSGSRWDYRGLPWSHSLHAHLTYKPIGFPLPQCLMEVYQLVGRHEVPSSRTTLKHSIDLPAYLYKPIVKTLLKYPPTQNPYDRDWGAILSYDVPEDATPPSEEIPDFESVNFKAISRVYKNIDPIHLHMFDPPRYKTEEREIGEGPEIRSFLNYPVASYVFTVRPLERTFGHLTNPFRLILSYANNIRAYFYLRWTLRARRKDKI